MPAAASEADEGPPPNAAAIIRNVGSTCAHSDGCLVLVMHCGSVVTSHDYSCAAAAAAGRGVYLVAAQ